MLIKFNYDGTVETKECEARIAKQARSKKQEEPQKVRKRTPSPFFPNFSILVGYLTSGRAGVSYRYELIAAKMLRYHIVTK